MSIARNRFTSPVRGLCRRGFAVFLLGGLVVAMRAETLIGAGKFQIPTNSAAMLPFLGQQSFGIGKNANRGIYSSGSGEVAFEATEYDYSEIGAYYFLAGPAEVAMLATNSVITYCLLPTTNIHTLALPTNAVSVTIDAKAGQ